MAESVSEEKPSRGEERRGSAAAAGGAPHGAAFRLDKRTHLNGVGYRGSFIEYGDGLAEVSFGFVSTVIRSKTVRGLSENREENEERSVRRAKKLLRQKVLASGANHLLTLTYRENVSDLDLANDHLTVFIRRIRRQHPGYPYVAVAERQKRGAWHWHLAVCGWQDVKFLRATWRRIVGDGNIDVKPPRKAAGDNPRLGIVWYLCKYLGKAFGEEGALNARRFRSSRIEVPETRRMLPVRTADEASDLCKAWISEASRGTFQFTHDGRWNSGWGRTW